MDQFFADLQAYSDWWKQAEVCAPTALPLGNATPSAAETLNAVRAKVDDSFTRCRFAEFDALAVAVLNRSQEDLAALGIMALISGPSMVIVWLKLRQRNLGPILDASGWAVNARVKVNIPFGRSLTGIAKLPPGASRSLQDPYRDKSARGKLWFWRILVLIAAVLVAYYVLKTYLLAP